MIYAPPECVQEINEKLEHKTKGFPLDGEFHRFGKDKRCWAVGKTWIFKDDDYSIVKFGDWRYQGAIYTWKSWSSDHSSRRFNEKFNAAMDEMARKHTEERERKHKECAEKWEPLYRGANQDPISQYLKDKNINDNYMGRNLGKLFIVPAFNCDGFVGVQIITKKGKKFSTGIRKKGSFCPVKYIEKPAIIYFTEGYATACSVYMATGELVIACFDCGNLNSAISVMRNEYKDIPFVICADNDEWTDGNPGISKAVVVSRNVENVKVIHPNFKNKSSKPTDFNDLHCKEGLDEVRKQILHESSVNEVGVTSFQKYIDEGFSYIEFTATGDEKVRRLPIILRNYMYHLSKFINCQDSRQTYVYKSGFYQSIPNAQIEEFSQKHYKPDLESSHQAKEFFNLVKRTRNGDIDILRQKTNSSLICFKNGVLDYDTMEFKDHSNDYYFFNQIPYDYDEKAKCPWWEELLMNLTLERDYMMDAIEEFLGYIISGMEYKYNKILILKGAGANGKSSLIRAMGQVSGDHNCAYAQVSQMAANRFMTHDLKHKLVNFSEEDPPKKVFSDTSFIKLLTGNSGMRVEQKGQASTSIINYAKLVMAYNELPFLTDFSEGMRRRLLIVPFEMDYQRLPHRKIKDLFSKVDSERSGIANKAIIGLRRLLKQDDFTIIPETKDEINEIMKGSDTVREWWSECIELTDNELDRAPFSELYSHYKDMMGGHDRITKIRFGKKVRNIIDDVSKTKKNITYGTMKINSMYGVACNMVSQKGVQGIKLR